jgi:hypothetical protein
MSGIVFICEGITIKLGATSLLKHIRENPKSLIAFILTTTLSAIALEGSAQWLGKLWIYPYFTSELYTFVFIPGFAGYFLMIGESYITMKAILDTLTFKKYFITRYYSYEPKMYRLFGCLGVIMVPLSIFMILLRYKESGGYIFDVSTLVNYQVRFIWIMTLIIGICFICEYIEYKHKTSSFLKDVLHHYTVPLAAVLAAAILLALIMETENLHSGYWRYTHWPYTNLHIFGLPLVMIFVAWPMQYIMFLSIFRVITPKESKNLWLSPHGNVKVKVKRA